MSYYTKYRPQTIGDLDLVAAREALLPILKSNTFSHAYLFVGPKGTGKTSSARIVAKVLNCEKNGDKLHEPCNVCENCKRITAGSSLACIEMDAASNRGIDDIRTLRERVGLTPSEGRYTVYIIDEVHMLTTEAFNALLKTLEEPPDHAVFILCTTDPQKIPDTVVSRCTKVQFLKATVSEVVASLHKAILGEKLTVDEAAVKAIAEAVDGSFRDGMKLLEQLAQQKEGVISLDDVCSATGRSKEYDPQALFDALMSGDVNQALSLWFDRQEGGVDICLWTKRLLEYVRQQLLQSVTEKSQSMSKLVNLAETVDRAMGEMKMSSLPGLVFEVMVVKWCTQMEPKQVESKREVVEEKMPTVIAVSQDFFQGELEEVRNKWQAILAAVKPLNHSLEALLRSARPKQVKNGTLQIEAFYKFHKEQLEQERHRRKLEQAIASVLGAAIRLEIVLGERAGTNQAEVAQVENISGAVEDDELVKAAEEIFGA